MASRGLALSQGRRPSSLHGENVWPPSLGRSACSRVCTSVVAFGMRTVCVVAGLTSGTTRTYLILRAVNRVCSARASASTP